MYGQKFKALRLQQHISLEQAANRVISPSTLSRWENNKIDIRFNLVIKLLDNIHINLKEFTNYCKINHSNPFVAKVAMYYEANDDRHILQLIQSKKKNTKIHIINLIYFY
ncbi:MAG: helix-turn-helix domain-containing protein [Lactobacillus crispatus]|nr:helix-turn-helix domain-containing protein [Lactobacillus crispatus]